MSHKFQILSSLKEYSLKENARQFLLSLLATTVSIALTFGTAAIIDDYKKEQDKHEIVMMVIYDMYCTLQQIEQVDSNIREAMDLQLQISKDTTTFDELRFLLIHKTPSISFTETTEHIFSSSIETINTVDNLLFTQNVAEFYLARKQYASAICDTLINSISIERPFNSLKRTLDFDLSWYAMASQGFFSQMQEQYDQCKQMMDISDDEINAYWKRRKHIEENSAGRKNTETFDKIIELQQEIQENAERLNLE